MIALLLASSLLATEYRFATPDHEITMTVRFEAPYRGTPLGFFKGGRRQCYTGKCIEKFHGAAAVVSFTVAKAHGKAPKVRRFRELVTIVEQSLDMPATPPFDLTLAVADGRVSDLQVMGYDEDEIPGADAGRGAGADVAEGAARVVPGRSVAIRGDRMAPHDAGDHDRAGGGAR